MRLQPLPRHRPTRVGICNGSRREARCCSDETPNSKLQTSEKSQTPNSKIEVFGVRPIVWLRRTLHPRRGGNESGFDFGGGGPAADRRTGRAAFRRNAERDGERL